MSTTLSWTNIKYMDSLSADVTAPSAIAGISIAALERDTGLGKDTLRVWERRYGFPQPLRDSGGERVYPADQVEHLRLIKRLMDQGQRPGVLLRTPRDAIVALAAQFASSQSSESAGDDAAMGETVDWVIPLLKNRNVEHLRNEFAQRLARDGLEHFVINTLPRLNRRIGDGWMTREIEVFEEHLYTELIQNQLRAAIYALASRGQRPQVLLSTVKDEEHLLGLLMVEALLAANGAYCLSLGAQTPVADIVGAANGTTTDIIALSFSAAYPWRKARDTLVELRAALPEHTELWAGGAALTGRGGKIPGVRVIDGLHEIKPALSAWHATNTLR